MDVVVVESPAKAKTINKYLGPGYKVLASYGHVRDLPSKNGSVRPEDDFAMDWEVDSRATKRLADIAAALKGAKRLYLATDPDREGEAISWHVREVLKSKKALTGIEVRRVVFNEITKSAIQAAFEHPRELDRELVDAYLARRALDYLVGFTLSPVLWRKLPGSRSAGRVQSVALRLICERELEIEKFVPREYWTVGAEFQTPEGAPFSAFLAQLDGAKLDKFALRDKAAAEAARRAVEGGRFSVAAVERKQQRRNPLPPFITSTLQQESSRKLNLATKRTMQIAQGLYEGVSLGGETVGLITYMRTDGVQIAGEAMTAARQLIERDYGKSYLPDQPRVYKSRAANAQEAHEAIRPTDLSRRPEDIARFLDGDQLKLYTLIWKRTIASQMEAAVLDQVAADIASADGRTVMRATGSTFAFDGFQKLYHEDRDDSEVNGNGAAPASPDDDTERRLPPLKEGAATPLGACTADQHFTQPPPRFTEASLVKRLEELGIGRPSTYASIISVLQERDYVRLDRKRFIPEDRGRLVTAFLASFFNHYVEYGFTANLEEKLDDISGGRIEWKTVLREFWTDFSKAVEGTRELRVSQVLDTLDALLGPHFFPPRADGKDPRACPGCADGRLNLKLGRFGAFIGCSNYPECRHTRPLAVQNGADEGDHATTALGPKLLGQDPASGAAVTLRKGPYGFYVQLGETPPGVVKGAKKVKDAVVLPKPKRQSLPSGVSPAQMDLEHALKLLSLPREICRHPETNEPIFASVGRFGPYVQHHGHFVSLKGDDDVLIIGANRAIALLAEAAIRSSARTLGVHPSDGIPVISRRGRFGAYVQHGKMRANLAKGTDLQTIALEAAIALLAARGQTAMGTSFARGRGRSRPRGGKATPAPKAARKPAGKKADAVAS
ncbi:MAG: type I DNA topoisomerase [Rhodospirillales bacterium]|nr:type I DNA topoisomerase [Rhodospirillales bacterium]MSP80627.1 type I DNA topoisomerase [Rhodospirillales bacterium]